MSAALDIAIVRARFKLRGIIHQYPSLYMPYLRWRSRSRTEALVVDKETEIVIDGYARSANSFSWAAFTIAQDRPVRIAHHIHATCQITFGVKLGIPVILLIRDPDDVAISIKLIHDYVDASQIYRNYIRFYKTLLPYQDKLVVADFPTVTSDFGKIIKTVNEKFGTSFIEFNAEKEEIQRCLNFVDSHWEKNDQKFNGTRARTPSAYRRDLKISIRHTIEEPQLADLRSSAKALHRSFVSD